MDILLTRRNRWFDLLPGRSSTLFLPAATLVSVGVVRLLRRRLLVDGMRCMILIGILWLGTLVLGILPHGISGPLTPDVPPRRLMRRFRFVRGFLLAHRLPMPSNLPTGRICVTPLRIPSSGCGALFGPLVDRTGRVRPHSLPGPVLPQPRGLMRWSPPRSNLPTRRIPGTPLLRDGPPVGGLVGRTRCRTPGYRLPVHRLLLRRALVGYQRARRIMARRPLRNRGTIRLRRPGGRFRLRLFPDAQQRPQRDQNATQNQNAPAPHGIIHQAASGFSGGN
jgi:hypothetical protein